MVESMIERVAAAIRKADAERGTYYGIDEVDALTLARAAIEKMREPTDAMVDAALSATGFFEDGSNDYLVHYQSMIDAALNEQVAG